MPRLRNQAGFPEQNSYMIMDFQHFGLHEAVVHGVQSMGYSEPTPIQARAIPIVLGGGDLMGSAQTGTGLCPPPPFPP